MYVDINKNAVLFYKALEDIWAAEQTYYGSPNISVYHCCQAVEKAMKGFMDCANTDYSHNSHNLLELLRKLEEGDLLDESLVALVNDMSMYDQNLRYKNMRNDPTVHDAKQAVLTSSSFVTEIGKHEKCSQFMNEAKEVHEKMLAKGCKVHNDNCGQRVCK